MFDGNDFDENVVFCKYVFDENARLDLGLEYPEGIQEVANFYSDIMFLTDDNHSVDEEELCGDEKALLIAVKRYSRFFKKRVITNTEMEIRSYLEREYNRNGGYSFSDSFDDETVESIADKVSFKH